MLGRPDYSTLKSSGIADLQSRLDYLEHTVLRDTPYIGGEELSVADIHAIWGVRWDLYGAESKPPGLGNQVEPGVGKSKYPKVWRLIESLPYPDPKVISFEEAWTKIKDSQYTSDLVGVWNGDPTGIKAGAQVTVDSLGSVFGLSSSLNERNIDCIVIGPTLGSSLKQASCMRPRRAKS